MRILVVFFLATFAGSYGERSECLEKTESCMDTYRDRTNMVPVYQFCGETVKAIECLEKDLDSCAGDELEDKVKASLKSMEEDRDEYCNLQISSEDDDIQNCLEEHEDVFFQCIPESVDAIFQELEGQSETEVTEDRIECGMFMLSGKCILNKVADTCGFEAAMEVMGLISDVPDHIQEACKSIGIWLHSKEFNMERKK